MPAIARRLHSFCYCFRMQHPCIQQNGFWQLLAPYELASGPLHDFSLGRAWSRVLRAAFELGALKVNGVRKQKMARKWSIIIWKEVQMVGFFQKFSSEHLFFKALLLSLKSHFLHFVPGAEHLTWRAGLDMKSSSNIHQTTVYLCFLKQKIPSDCEPESDGKCLKEEADTPCYQLGTLCHAFFCIKTKTHLREEWPWLVHALCVLRSRIKFWSNHICAFS